MTTVFKCESCGCADDIHATHTTSAGYLCAVCVGGDWHGQFPREQYDFNIHGPALNVVDPHSGDQISFG